MPNPFAQYAKPSNPFAVYKTQGTGPKPPPNFAPAGSSVAPLHYIPGSADDPALIAQQAAARQGPEIAGQSRLIQQRLQAALEEERRKRAMGPDRNSQFDNVSGMRKELEGRNEVQVYKNALPSYASALKSPDTPAGDQDMIYAFAKIMDPNSVVREGEANSVAALGTMGQQIVGQLRKQLDSQGKFTPELRAQLRNTLANRMGEYNKAYNYERGFFTDMAKRNGLNPEDIVGPHLGDQYAAVENEYFRHDPNKSAAAARAELTAPKAGDTGAPGGSQPPIYLGGGGAPSTLASGANRNESDPRAAGVVDAIIRGGGSLDQVNEYVTSLGHQTPITQEQYDAAHKLMDMGYKGPLSSVTRAVPNSAWNNIASSPGGVGVGAGFDAALGGLSDEATGGIDYLRGQGSFGDLVARADAKKQAAYAADPKAALAGKLGGNILGMWGGGKLLSGLGVASKIGKSASYLGATGYGAVEGAGQNNDNRVFGAGVGAMAAGVGFPVGQVASIPVNAALRTRPGMAFATGVRDVAGKIPGVKQLVDGSPVEYAPQLSGAENLAANVINKGDPLAIKAQLDEAARLGVPMSLADTSKRATLETANAVRRSPDAATFADNVLSPRSRGQIDRLRNGVANNLGPVENAPQLSADLAKSAQANAGPLYDKAYAAGQIDDPAINGLLQHPDLQPILADAKQLHANDVTMAKARGETPPPPLTTVVGPNGEYTPPDVRTIDYVQRALRGRVDSAYSGDSAAKMNAPFLRDARNLILQKADVAAPDFAAARAAYGGPMQSRDALDFGKKAFSMDPNTLGVEAGKFSPEQLAQGQVGFRGQLVDTAEKLRYNTNPFESTLGNPAAEARLRVLHPDNQDGVSNLIRQRDLELQLAKSQNRILGGSTTDENAIGSKSFLSPHLGAVADIGSTMATGGVPVLPMAKLGYSGVKNVLKLGAEKRAVQKAEEFAPIMLNTDPSASSATVDDILQRLSLRRQFEQRQNLTRPMGMFGASLGAAAPNAYRPF